MPKVILRNKATKQLFPPMEQSDWEKLKDKWSRIVEEVSVIETPPEIEEMRNIKQIYKDGKLQY